MDADCVAGAIQKQVYQELIEANGFKSITAKKDKAVIVPDDILSQYLSAEQIAALNNQEQASGV